MNNLKDCVCILTTNLENRSYDGIVIGANADKALQIRLENDAGIFVGNAVQVVVLTKDDVQELEGKIISLNNLVVEIIASSGLQDDETVADIIVDEPAVQAEKQLLQSKAGAISALSLKPAATRAKVTSRAFDNLSKTGIYEQASVTKPITENPTDVAKTAIKSRINASINDLAPGVNVAPTQNLQPQNLHQTPNLQPQQLIQPAQMKQELSPIKIAPPKAAARVQRSSERQMVSQKFLIKLFVLVGKEIPINNPIEITIKDISSGGMLFESAPDFNVGSTFVLEFKEQMANHKLYVKIVRMKQISFFVASYACSFVNIKTK